MADCIFCKIARGEIPCAKLYEDDHVLSFLDIQPINPGHALVIPKRHYSTLFEIPEDYHPLTAIAIGYPGDPGILPDRQKERELAERKRRDPDEFVYSEKFGKSSGLFR